MPAFAPPTVTPTRPAARFLVRRSALLGLTATATLLVAANARADDDAAAEIDGLEPVITVIGDRIRLDTIPGSATVIDAGVLVESRVFTINEAMRKVPGVFARDEEGLGLRPNLGVRGLNPTRSGKVLLLEDGIPIAYAPYGDNATYYHPPVERFERIEVLKGSGQIAYGPHTVGAVINYITPPVPDDREGRLVGSFGNKDFREIHGVVGDTFGSTGFIAHGTYKETDGARDNMHFEVGDVNLKVAHALTERQAVTVRASYYDETSQVTYSGLTLAEWQADPYQNPFKHDTMDAQRFGTSATHRFELSPAVSLTTNAYYTYFNRDWWRQSSNSAQRPNDASDPACAGMANLSTTCGNEGRLRQYWTAGLEPRAAVQHGLFGVDNVAEAGIRYHVEDQFRVQANGDNPTSREPGTGGNAGIREDSDRTVEAMSAFVQNRFDFGRWTVTPGVRFEHVDYERTDNLTAAKGKSTVDEVVPGIGTTYEVLPQMVMFAGVHRGFAPPGVADIVTAAGGSVELDAELSWNYELGLRANPRDGLSYEADAFPHGFRKPDRASQRRRRFGRGTHQRRRNSAAGTRAVGQRVKHGFRRMAVRSLCARVLHMARGCGIRRRAVQQHCRLRHRQRDRQPPALRARAPARGHGRCAHRLRTRGIARRRLHQFVLHRRSQYRRDHRERAARAKCRATRSGT